MCPNFWKLAAKTDNQRRMRLKDIKEQKVLSFTYRRREERSGEQEPAQRES